MEKLILNKNDTENIVKYIKEKGICVIKNFITIDKISNYEQEFDHILISNKNKCDSNYGNNICLRTNVNTDILNSNKYPLINNIFTSNYIKSISNRILKNIKYDNVFIHHDVESVNSNNTYPHFDYDRKLKFYICLNEMNTTNGCFKALPEKQKLVRKKRSINRRKNIFTKGHNLYNSTNIEMNELIPIVAEAGDLIIFDTNCIHAGGDNFEEGKFRKVIRLHLSGSW
jgi:ectoine hydroxylase-related dioxygenase (phytanoyl-CoA dioxygenase family)